MIDPVNARSHRWKALGCTLPWLLGCGTSHQKPEEKASMSESALPSISVEPSPESSSARTRTATFALG